MPRTQDVVEASRHACSDRQIEFSVHEQERDLLHYRRQGLSSDPPRVLNELDIRPAAETDVCLSEIENPVIKGLAVPGRKSLCIPSAACQRSKGEAK